jgi:hypothetical protein
VNEDKVWNAMAGAVAVGAVRASTPLIERGWRMATGSEPPENPAREDVTWRDAILWALITGAVFGIVRLVAQRSAAGAWKKARGQYPAALRSVRP